MLTQPSTYRLPEYLTASEARENFYDILGEVGNMLRRFVISLKGKPVAVMMPLEELGSLEETIDVMSDESLMRSIRQSEREYKAGKYYTLEEVMKEIENKPDHKNGTNINARGPKAAKKAPPGRASENQ